MPRFRASSVIKALDHAIAGSKDVCFTKEGKEDINCNVGRRIAIQTLERFTDVETIEDLRKAVKVAESESRTICDQYDGQARSSCAAGRIAVIGLFRNELAQRTKIELMGIPSPQLGIFVSPGEKCPHGFEKIKGIKGGPNKKIEACRLADGFRKHKPEDRPKGKPLRRLRKFGPGVEADKILPLREHGIRKSSRRLQED